MKICFILNARLGNYLLKTITEWMLLTTQIYWPPVYFISSLFVELTITYL